MRKILLSKTFMVHAKGNRNAIRFKKPVPKTDVNDVRNLWDIIRDFTDRAYAITVLKEN